MLQRKAGVRERSWARWVASVALVASCVACAGQAAPPKEGQKPSQPETKAPITSEEAKELFRSVDDILSFASADTKLPIEHPVKRRLISRDEVNRYLKEKFDEDEGRKRMERSEIVLKKFGLLDRDFHLGPFLLSLLTEQIAGFYDNKTKTVNLLDWIEPEEQKPVLAHELTHALQDQKIGLTKWSSVSLNGPSHNVREDNRHLEVDEADTARSAVAEGQAMAVFVDYTLRPSGKTLANSPEIMDRMKDQVADTSGSPVMARAPLLLQESLLFPYSEGLNFEQAILVKGGKEAAFAGVLANPPSSSFEIIHPAAYMAHTPVPLVRLPDIHPLLDADYSPYDIGVMGELDVRILIELFGGREMADALAPAWNGGVYYAAQRKSAVTAAEKESTASLGLIYYSRWKNRDSARSFLNTYAAQIPRKYSNVAERQKDERDEVERVYSTSEGDVLISLSGTGVFISEGFELALARKLREKIVSVQPEGPIRQASAPMHEPSLSLSRVLASYGAVNAEALQRYTSRGSTTETSGSRQE